MQVIAVHLYTVGLVNMYVTVGVQLVGEAVLKSAVAGNNGITLPEGGIPDKTGQLYGIAGNIVQRICVQDVNNGGTVPGFLLRCRPHYSQQANANENKAISYKVLHFTNHHH
jgi:hypothetical protein